MESSLSNLVNNLAETIHKIKCKNCETVELNKKIVSTVLNTQTLKIT